MTISIARVEDIPDLVVFSQRLHQTTPYRKFRFAADKVAKAFRDAITGDPTNGMVLIAKRDGKAIGTIGATVIEPHYSRDRLAAEWVWWVDQGQSPRLLFELLEGLEYWAKHVAKCKSIIIGRINNKPTSFQKRGYTSTETTLIKEL